MNFLSKGEGGKKELGNNLKIFSYPIRKKQIWTIDIVLVSFLFDFPCPDFAFCVRVCERVCACVMVATI